MVSNMFHLQWMQLQRKLYDMRKFLIYGNRIITSSSDFF